MEGNFANKILVFLILNKCDMCIIKYILKKFSFALYFEREREREREREKERERERESIHLFVWAKYELNGRENNNFL